MQLNYATCYIAVHNTDDVLLIYQFSLTVNRNSISGYRLSGSRIPSEGRLEAIVDGQWGAVRYQSRYNFKDHLDDLFCQDFGYV